MCWSVIRVMRMSANKATLHVRPHTRRDNQLLRRALHNRHKAIMSFSTFVSADCDHLFGYLRDLDGRLLDDTRIAELEALRNKLMDFSSSMGIVMARDWRMAWMTANDYVQLVCTAIARLIETLTKHHNKCEQRSDALQMYINSLEAALDRLNEMTPLPSPQSS